MVEITLIRVQKIYYLSEVVDNIDFSCVRGICFWNMKFLRLFGSVDFNCFIKLFACVLKLDDVLGHGFLRSQKDIIILHLLGFSIDLSTGKQHPFI